MSFEYFTSIEEYAKAKNGPCVATLGTFDGYHLGHASIFEHLKNVGKKLNLPTLVITFHPHPRVLVTPENPPQLLTTPDEKIEILRLRFDGSLVFINFDDNLRRMTADTFAKNVLLKQFHVKALVVGYNHSFGYNRSGNIEHLREIGQIEGFDVHVAGPVTHKEIPISSSRIRQSISKGAWKNSISMLGHPYPIHGTVIKGIGRGKKLGWPTVNIDWSDRKMLPPEGVYSCLATFEGTRYKGMMFIGVNSLNPKEVVSVEANLFDFDRDIYGRQITLCPLHFLRSNIRFDSKEELSNQIANDKENIVKLLS